METILTSMLTGVMIEAKTVLLFAGLAILALVVARFWRKLRRALRWVFGASLASALLVSAVLIFDCIKFGHFALYAGGP